MSEIKFYADLRRIRIGKDANGEELTVRYFKRLQKGMYDGAYAKIYVGLSDVTSRQVSIKKWDARYEPLKDYTRMKAVQTDWLSQFNTPDISEPNNPSPKRKEAATSDTDAPVSSKKMKLQHQDDNLNAWLKGEHLTKAQLTRLAKQFRVGMRLKQEPPWVSSRWRLMSWNAG